MSDEVAQILADELTFFINNLPEFFSSIAYPLGYLLFAFLAWGFFSWLLSMARDLAQGGFNKIR